MFDVSSLLHGSVIDITLLCTNHKKPHQCCGKCCGKICVPRLTDRKKKERESTSILHPIFVIWWKKRNGERM